MHGNSATVHMRVEVRDASGAPVADASVSILRASQPVPEMAFLTDAEGGLDLGLPPGSIALTATAGTASGEVKAVIRAASDGPLRIVIDN